MMTIATAIVVIGFVNGIGAGLLYIYTAKKLVANNPVVRCSAPTPPIPNTDGEGKESVIWLTEDHDNKMMDAENNAKDEEEW